ANGQRGPGVPEQMRWLPLVTFLQTGMDAMNAMLKGPGEFTSFGHDYRADMAWSLRDAPPPPRAPAPRPGGNQSRGGVPLPSPRTRGGRWIGRRGPNGRPSTSAADRS